MELPADDRSLEELLVDRRFGPPFPDEATPWDFVRRWPDATLRARVWPVVSRLLVDGDELVRARAIEFVRTWSDSGDLTMPRLLEVAEHHSALFGDQRPEGPSLRHELAFALSNHVNAANGARVAAVLRDMATHEPIGGGAAGVLGRYEPIFVGAQAQKWGDSQASWINDAARSLALFRRDAIIPFLDALRGLGQTTRARILATVEDYIKRDDATASTLARGQGLPPPAKPAPSEADCRRAIGL